MNPGAQPGLLSALKRGLRTSAELAEVRLALFATELQQEKLRLLESVAWMGLALLAVAAGLVLSSLWLLMLLGEQHRLTALGVLALVYFGAAALAWRLARGRQAQGGSAFQATLAEFRRDREALFDAEEEVSVATLKARVAAARATAARLASADEGSAGTSVGHSVGTSAGPDPSAEPLR